MLSRTQQLALARAVCARDTARLLNPDNSAGPPVPLADAVASGSAYFVTPRAGLLVVDLDLPADTGRAAAAARAFGHLIAHARGAGVPVLVSASGTGDNRHAFLAVDPGADRAVIRDWCQARGLDVRDRGIRPPGSAHRDGTGVSTLLAPVSVADALTALSAGADPVAGRALARALAPVNLPAKARAALRHGHAAAGYASPSHARMGLAVAIRARGGPRNLLDTLLADQSSPLGQTFRNRPVRWQRQELDRLWDKAGTWLGSRPPSGPIHAALNTWAAALTAGAWSGLAGGTDLAVAEMLLTVARRAHTLTPAAAVADVACEAGVSVDTARRSVRRLIEAGWLAVHAPESARTARVYQLTYPDGSPGTAGEPGGADPGPAEEFGQLGADVARWRALGKLSVRAGRTLRHTGPVTVPQLAAALHWAPAAVRHHLRKLAAAGLAVRDGYVWRPVAVWPVLSELAARFGTSGMRAAQRDALTRLREARAAALSAYRAAYRPGGRQRRPDPYLRERERPDPKVQDAASPAARPVLTAWRD